MQLFTPTIFIGGYRLRIRLEDARETSLPLAEVPWRKWPAQTTPRQRANWRALKPGGYAVY